MSDEIPFMFQMGEIPPATGDMVRMVAMQACEAHDEKRLMPVHPEIVLALTTLIEENWSILFPTLPTGDIAYDVSQRRVIFGDDNAPAIDPNEFVDYLVEEDGVILASLRESELLDERRGPVTGGKYQPSFADEIHKDRWGCYPDEATSESAQDMANRLQREGGAV